MPSNDLLTAQQRKYSPAEARERIRAWCARQERAQQEVRDKLYGWGLHSEEVEALIADLISTNFLNEERFARAFASGKFRIKRWGRVKIIAALQQKRVSPPCIRAALKEIDPAAYNQTMLQLIERKAPLLRSLADFEQRHKIAAYMAQKGYESELVWEAIERYFNSPDFSGN